MGPSGGTRISRYRNRSHLKFDAKEVPYRLLGLISRDRERAFHGQVWSVVEQAVRGEVRPFDFYFDFVCARAEELKPLWEMDPPLG